jgi:hypothetical protein
MTVNNKDSPYMARLRAKKKANVDNIRVVVASVVSKRLNMPFRDVFEFIAIDDCETEASNHLKAARLNSRSQEGDQSHCRQQPILLLLP